MRPGAVVFLQGIAAAGAWAAGLFFFRFFHETRDRLFAYFGAAFWILALSWVLLGLFSPTDDTRPYVYGLRLVAFALIIVGTVEKNRVQR